MSVRLHHARVTLHLAELRAAEGTPLLLLHALGGSHRDWISEPALDAWPGPVWALDFSGHGHSGRVCGASYTAELLVADADHALFHLEHACLAGVGLGAYVAGLLAGARSDAVPAALLLPGAGLAGGGAEPKDGEAPEVPLPEIAPFAGSELQGDPSTDALAVAQLSNDVRPPDYAAELAAGAQRLLLAPTDAERPPWWRAFESLERAERLADSGCEGALAALARSAAP